jgi:hypothetical protein
MMSIVIKNKSLKYDAVYLTNSMPLERIASE